MGPTGTEERAAGRFLPLYEAKMVHHFDHQWATYERDGTVREVTPEEKADPAFHVMPRYWVAEAEVEARLGAWPHDWLLGWREVCRSTDERTVIGAAISRTAVGHKYQLALPSNGEHALGLVAVLSSLVIDFVARQKIGGTAMSYFLMKQLPIPPPAAIGDDMLARVAGLASVFTMSARESKDLARAALDAAMFRLYEVAREDAEYIIDTFAVLRRNEEARLGEFRTKRLVLDAYDAATSSRSPAASVS